MYVKGVVGAFADDDRVLMWDLYNEPGELGMLAKSLPLLKKAFEWTREAGPSQPVTAGLWCDWERNGAINAYCVGNSDVISFHNYDNENLLREEIAELRKYDRPIVCTEYMARTKGSFFANCMPVF